MLIHSLTLSQGYNVQTVFEVELPDFHLPPSSEAEIVAPSSSVNQLFVHVLKPAADNIDYSAISVNVNGHASSTVSEVVAGLRGKLVKINLQRHPGFQFAKERITVEVWAQNRRGRMYYSSFIIKTKNENRNEDFSYEVQLAPGASKEISPRLVLLEPERPVEVVPTLNSTSVIISGIATASTVIKRVSVDGLNAKLTVVPKTSTRQLTRVTPEERSVSFQATSTIGRNTRQIIVEAEDQTGSRIRVVVPVLSKKPVTTSTFTGKKYALVVGISTYKNKGISNLEYADVDANAVYQFLQQPAAGGFTRENTLLLTNENATLANVRDALTNFITRASENDLLLIFFAGHGAPDLFAPRDYYLLTHDTKVADMPNTALAMADLQRYIVQNVRSKRVVLMLDACHSAGVSMEGTRNLSNNLANLYLQKLLYQEEGRVIITSSDVSELSRESQKWGNGHGVFTYYLLEGLRGKADTNRDRMVSVGELFRYVRQQVRLDTDFQQNPRMLAGKNENLSLAVAR